MDEVLAVDVARQSTISDVIHGIWIGTDFSPPTYHLLMHVLTLDLLPPASRLVWRSTSILAVLAAAGCVFLTVRRRGASQAAAILGFGLMLGMNLFQYAIQARPYGLLSLAFAAAVLAWTSIGIVARKVLAAVGLWVALASCAVLHFYGIVPIATIGLAEVIHCAVRRHIRWHVWVPLVLTIPVLVALYPLASHLASINAADNAAADFYGRPTLSRAFHAVLAVVGGGDVGNLLFIAILAFLLLAPLVWHLFRLPATASRSTPQAPLLADPLLIALCIMPLLTVIVSFVITKTFSPRYLSPAAILPAIVGAQLLDRAGNRRSLGFILALVLMTTLLARIKAPDPLAAPLALLAQAPAGKPIVVGEGLLYIELMYAADPVQRTRLVYLRTPSREVNTDPTNEHEVQRLALIEPDYRVYDQPAFLANNPNFLLLARPNATQDATTPSLLAQGCVGRPVAIKAEALLFEASASQQAGSVPVDRSNSVSVSR